MFFYSGEVLALNIWEIKVSQTQLSIIGAALIDFVDGYWCLAGHVSTPSLGHHQVIKIALFTKLLSAMFTGAHYQYI
jgi:hypothetical protein